MYVYVCFVGLVFSWGDGDFGKLGRGGSEGCNIPQNIERLNGQGVCQIECGAQFSLALTKSGVVWTWYDFKRRFGFFRGITIQFMICMSYFFPRVIPNMIEMSCCCIVQG